MVVLCLVGCSGPAAPAVVRPIEAPVRETATPVAPGRHSRIPRGPRDLDATAIRRVIRQRMAPVAACYEQLSPGDRRRVIIRFTIGPDGTVLRSTAGGPQGVLENCIAAAFAGTTFEPPASGGTVTVTYPLQFRPG